MAAMQAAVAAPTDAERPSLPAAMSGQLAIKNKKFFGSDEWVVSTCSFNPENKTFTISGPGGDQPRDVSVKGVIPISDKLKGGKERRANRFDITLHTGEAPLEVAADSSASKVDWVTAICGTAGGDLGSVTYEDDCVAVHANGILVKNYYWGTCEHKFIWFADIKSIHLPTPQEGKSIPGHGWGIFTSFSPMATVMRVVAGRTYDDVWFAYNEMQVRHRHHYIILTENGSFRKGFAVRGMRRNRLEVAKAIKEGCIAMRGEAPTATGEPIPDVVPVTDAEPLDGGAAATANPF
jgi:hypothetical protein